MFQLNVCQLNTCTRGKTVELIGNVVILPTPPRVSHLLLYVTVQMAHKIIINHCVHTFNYIPSKMI